MKNFLLIFPQVYIVYHLIELLLFIYLITFVVNLFLIKSSPVLSAWCNDINSRYFSANNDERSSFCAISCCFSLGVLYIGDCLDGAR